MTKAFASPVTQGPLQPGDALLVVDLQRDYMPGGALAVPLGEQVLGPVNACLDRCAALWLPVFASRDWHPQGHSSFHGAGGTWPPHCVAGSEGAAFARGLRLPRQTELLSKGMARERDVLSAFDGTPLGERLSALRVRRLVVAGLATDHGVLATVLDALRLGFAVAVPLEGVAAVDLQPGDGERALVRMQA
ncbi:MAG TPA: isochorismatase family protein, partial [Burkholderiaceae bacterium]|nr:isochorismatase family protein [Burkholderiaceae bacterium]